MQYRPSHVTLGLRNRAAAQSRKGVPRCKRHIDAQELEAAAHAAVQSESKAAACSLLLSESEERMSQSAAELQVRCRKSFGSNAMVCQASGTISTAPLAGCSLCGPQGLRTRQADAEAEMLRARTEAMEAQLVHADLQARSDW
jgi:hypothetical protein